MTSRQTLTHDERMAVSGWAADCAARVLHLFEDAAPGDRRAREAIERARAFADGRVDAAEMIRTRGGDGSPAATRDPAALAAAKAAGQAGAVAHMGAHGLGAAAYAAVAASLGAPHPDAALDAEVRWQVAAMPGTVRRALSALPPVGEDRAGPLGPGLLSRGAPGRAVRALQRAIARGGEPERPPGRD